MSSEDKLVDALNDVLTSRSEENKYEEPANIVDSLFAIARAIESVATQVRDLGMGNAATSMEAIECLTVIIKDGLSEVATAIADD